jgi:ABC-type molybdate transport system substrate-binding protein
MLHTLGLCSFIAAASLLVAPKIALATEIKVPEANAFTGAMRELATGFTKETGRQVTFVGVSPGQVEERIKADEVYDLVITASASAQVFEKEGRWTAGSLWR